MNPKRYYWIKLRTDIFADDSPVDFLLSQPNGSEYVCIYLKLCTMTANKEGRLCNEIGEIVIPYDVEKLQKSMKYFSIDTIRVALELYKKLGLIYEEQDGILAITGASDMVGSECDSAKRMRLSRSRRQMVSQCDADVTETISQCDIENRDKENRDKEIRDKRLDKETDNGNKKDKGKAKGNGGENSKGRTKGAPVSYYPDELLDKAFSDFVEMRKAKKKPMTAKAIELAMKELKQLSTIPFSDSMDNDLAIKIIEQSILKGWSSFYPLKDASGGRSKGIDWENL